MTDFLRMDDPRYPAAVTGFNTYFEIAPEVAVAAATVDDVAAAVRYAGEHGMPVRAFATGHGTHAPIDGGMLINVSALDTVTIDPAARTASIGGGARWSPVVAAAAEHGLAPITGSSPAVGVSGYIQGGGLGPLARSHGFSSDRVVGYTVVTADGAVRTVDAGSEPELFWAMRGGKGGFGVVVETRVCLVELATLYGGALVFDTPDIERVLRGWLDWTATADARVTTSVAVINFPPFEEVPPPLRGRRLLMLRFAFPGDAVTGEELAAPLRALAPVYLDGLHEMNAADIGLIHNDPTNPGPGWGLGGAFSRVDGGLVDALLPFLGPDAAAPFIAVEIRHVGAAAATDVPEGSAVGGRDLEYLFHLIGAPDPALFPEVLPAAGQAFLAGLATWIAPTTTPNWASAETLDTSWTPQTRDRIRAARASVDPTGMFPLS
jgi:hypothetical protein